MHAVQGLWNGRDSFVKEYIEPWIVKGIEGFFLSQALEGSYRIIKSLAGDRLEWILPEVPPQMKKMVDEKTALTLGSWAISLALPYYIKGPYSYPVWVACAVVRAVQLYFFKEKIPLPSFVKEAVSKEVPEGFKGYLKPLEAMKEGKINYVFAQTGVSLGLFAQGVAALFPKKEVYWIDGKVEKREELQEFLEKHPKALIFSNRRDAFKDLEIPKKAICCEVFAYLERTYSDEVRDSQERMELKALEEEGCLDACGCADNALAKPMLALVKALDQDEKTAGRISLDRWMQATQGKKIANKQEAARVIFDQLRETLHPEVLIALCRQLKIEYQPRKVDLKVVPSCLSVLEGRGVVTENTQELEKKLGSDFPHLKVFIKSVAQLRLLLVGYVKKPLFLLDINTLLNPEKFGLLLDYLYSNPDVVLQTSHSSNLARLLPLLPLQTQVVTHLSEPAPDNAPADGLEGWFDDLDLLPKPPPAGNPFLTAAAQPQTLPGSGAATTTTTTKT